MRLLHLYVVRDTKARTIIGPIVHDHSIVPITRQITEAANKPGLIGNNPEDFEIVWIGQIDEDTGALHIEVDNQDDHIIGNTSLQVRALALVHQAK